MGPEFEWRTFRDLGVCSTLWEGVESGSSCHGIIPERGCNLGTLDVRADLTQDCRGSTVNRMLEEDVGLFTRSYEAGKATQSGTTAKNQGLPDQRRRRSK